MGKDPIKEGDRIGNFPSLEERTSSWDDPFKRIEAKSADASQRMDQATDAAKDRLDKAKQNSALGHDNSQTKEPTVHVVDNNDMDARVAAAKARMGMGGTSASTTDYKSIEGAEFKTDKRNIPYKVTENGVVPNKMFYDIVSPQEVKNLRPKKYQLEDSGKFVRGPVEAKSANNLEGMTDKALRKVIVEHEVYQDIIKRGDNSNGAQAFKEKHKKDLDAWGLAVANGNLYQVNPADKTAEVPTPVKDAADLEKQVAKDKKEAAKNNPVLKQIQKEQVQR